MAVRVEKLGVSDGGRGLKCVLELACVMCVMSEAISGAYLCKIDFTSGLF
jgi:hypothetical protein